MGNPRTENQIVRMLRDTIQEKKMPLLKKTFVHTNLATKKFHDIWRVWWKTEPPPRLEVDMILVFEDEDPMNVFLVVVEVKYITSKIRKFYEGLQQILSFGLFGFDSLVLWHIFPEEMGNNFIDGFVKSVQEVIQGFELPVVYFATKLTEECTFEFFSPQELYSSTRVDAEILLRHMRNFCDKKRNPLLDKDEIEKRRRMLKTVLKIPV